MRAARILPALLAFAFSAGLPALAAADGGRTPKPAIVVESQGHCIEPAERMRRDHPSLLRHQRDATVRTGARGMPASLRACVSCHAGRASGSVLGASDSFCQSCHEFAAVRLDCFECHSSRVDRAPAAFAGAIAAGERP